jgi:hypothetical protein
MSPTGLRAVKALGAIVGHPQIDNGTPFKFEPIFIADEELRPVVVTVIKATYAFDLNGGIALAEEQAPVNVPGEPWSDAPVSSYKYEPEVALCKLATDIVLIGHAQAPGRGKSQVDVGIKIGALQKVARVFGDRFWVSTRVGVEMSRAAPLEHVPLTWENAFGGRDDTNSTPERPSFEARNPVGTGFGKPLTRDGETLRLPNIEDRDHLITEYGAVVQPCGFGFTSPNWQPRAIFGGTYDDRWDKTRKPMLPVDFDRRFFNAAAPGLVASGYLRGDEEVVVLNTTSVPRLAFRLPEVPPPNCRVVLRGDKDVPLPTKLDTVIVNTDERRLFLLWRAYTHVAGGPHDVTAIAVAMS